MQKALDDSSNNKKKKSVFHHTDVTLQHITGLGLDNEMICCSDEPLLCITIHINEWVYVCVWPWIFSWINGRYDFRGCEQLLRTIHTPFHTIHQIHWNRHRSKCTGTVRAHQEQIHAILFECSHFLGDQNYWNIVQVSPFTCIIQTIRSAKYQYLVLDYY